LNYSSEKTHICQATDYENANKLHATSDKRLLKTNLLKMFTKDTQKSADTRR